MSDGCESWMFYIYLGSWALNVPCFLEHGTFLISITIALQCSKSHCWVVGHLYECIWITSIFKKLSHGFNALKSRVVCRILENVVHLWSRNSSWLPMLYYSNSFPYMYINTSRSTSVQKAAFTNWLSTSTPSILIWTCKNEAEKIIGRLVCE